jgi:long-chain-fatty-acid--[acyl-carrier-protein] ligase
MVMLEDVKNEISLIDKFKAFYRSKLSTKAILRTFKSDRLLPSSKCVLLFTSGTESMPKGVPLSHENVLTNLQACAKYMELNSDDVIYGILPPFHAFGFSISCLFGLMTGMKIAFSPDPTDGRRLADGFEKWGVTIMVGAPTFVKNMLKFATLEQIKTMRICVTGAEKAPPELTSMVEALGKKGCLVEGYGITECSPVLTANPLDQERIGVGQAVAGVTLCIVHPETYENIPTGKQGLVLARGPNIFAGYLNHDVASPFHEHEGKQWYKTGDLGYLDEKGNLTITGRLKRFIKVGGEMVSLSAIEDALLRAGLRLGWPTSDEGPALAVCAKEIVGEKPKIFLFTKFETTTDQVNTCLKDSGFSNLVKISSVIRLAEIPIMGSGKVHYRSLEGQYVN